MTTLSLLALVILFLTMKVTAMLLRAPKAESVRGFVWTPLLAPNSMRRMRPSRPWFQQLPPLALGLAALVLGYVLYWKAVRTWPLHEILLGYMAAPLLWLISGSISRLLILFWHTGGKDIPAFHQNPFGARSVADFWSNRWNLWFSDWFRYTLFGRLRRRPVFALFLVFALSGLMHELIINVLLYFLTGRNLCGTMMIYFLMQAVGMLLERRWLVRYPRLNVVWAWVIVLGLVPLVINEGLLRVMFLWPE